MYVAILGLFHANEDWARLAGPSVEQRARLRLSALSAALGDKPYLDGASFTAGDLMMASVLRIIPALLAGDARLETYLDRCTARPAFRRALGAQLADFQGAA